jgi:hypothetical protein
MFKIQRKFVESCLLILLLLILFLLNLVSAKVLEPTHSLVVHDKVARKGERAADLQEKKVVAARKVLIAD